MLEYGRPGRSLPLGPSRPRRITGGLCASTIHSARAPNLRLRRPNPEISMDQRLRFGICIDQNLSWKTTVERWQQVEALGFDSVWDCDHYIQPSRPSGPYFEGWTLIAALAAKT